ncbi:MAG: hypothetical protein J0M10_14025 [Chitinophagales bacterium]|nr:hypothetical protein [Chitinophagales bacterium]
MKKFNLVLCFSLLSLVSLHAQETGFTKNDNLLNLGVGINSYYSGGIPLSISFERGISDNISAGVVADYLSDKYNYGNGSSYKFTALYLGARGSYHVNELLKINNNKIDVYAGLALGYRNFSWKNSYSGSSLSDNYGNGLFFGAFAGGKYYFSPAVGAFTELGATGSTNCRVGIAVKL